VSGSDKCTMENVYKMLIKIVDDTICPLCGCFIYYDDRFQFRHLPFVEDDGKVVTAGIICGYRGGQRLVLLRCTKGSGELDMTVPF